MSPISRAAGTFWALAERLGQRFFGFIFVILIARYAGPASFGVVAPVLVYFFFFEQCIVNVVRRRLIIVDDLTEEDSAFGLFLVYALASIGFAVALGIAGLVAFWGGDTELAVLIVIGAGLTFIKAAASPHLALLMRTFQYRYIAGISVVASIGGGIVGVWMAREGYGPYAVLTYQGLTFTLEAIGLAWAARSVLLPRWSAAQWNRHREFLRPVLVSEVLFFVGGRSEVLIMAFFIGEAALGSYFLARRYIDTIAEILNSSLANIAFSTYSRVTGPGLAEARSFFLMVATTTALPAFLGLLMIAPEVVRLTLGPEWREAEGLLQLLCVLGIPLAIGRVAMAFLVATESLRAVTILSRVGFALTLTAITATAPFGVVPVIVALTLAFSFMAWFGLHYVAERAAFLPTDLWRSGVAPSLATVAMLAAIALLPDDGGLAVTVVSAIAAGAVTYTIALSLLNPALLQAVRRRFARAGDTPAE